MGFQLTMWYRDTSCSALECCKAGACRITLTGVSAASVEQVMRVMALPRWLRWLLRPRMPWSDLSGQNVYVYEMRKVLRVRVQPVLEVIP